MIPTIGLVICGYVLVRMLELMLSADARPAVKQAAGLLMLGTGVAAVVLIMLSLKATRAVYDIPGTPGAASEYDAPGFDTTTITTVPYRDPQTAPLQNYGNQ
jgi:hypothetical protein